MLFGKHLSGRPEMLKIRTNGYPPISFARWSKHELMRNVIVCSIRAFRVERVMAMDQNQDISKTIN